MKLSLICSAAAVQDHGGWKGAAVPLSSSFFAGRLLKVLHHEVRSRREEAGSGVASRAGWGSPLRTRGVWGVVCVPAGMAGGRAGGAAAVSWAVAVRCAAVVARHRWVGSGQAAVWGAT